MNGCGARGAGAAAVTVIDVELGAPVGETVEENPWLLRSYEKRLDEDGMMSFLSASYNRSSAGKRAGASGYSNADPAGEEKRRAFERETRPIWLWLLEHAEVMLAVDSENPETSIWAWLVTSGPDVVHAVGCKRSAIAAGICRDLVLDLLGERWTRPQVVTLELPQMRAHRSPWQAPKDWFGFEKPSRWHLDPMWLAARMAAR